MNRFFVIFLILFLGLSTFGAYGCGGGGSNKPSGEQPVTPYPIPDDKTAPDPPRNVTAVPGDSAVVLNWWAVYSAIGYQIYQSRDGVTFLRLTSGVSFLNNEAILGNLENGKTYYFGVSAVDEHNNESGIAYVGGNGRDPKAFPVVPSTTVIPDQTPYPPTDFSWTAGDRKLLLTWKQPSSNYLTHYTVTRTMTISPFAQLHGSTKQQRDALRAAYEKYFHTTATIPGWIKNYPGGTVSGFTISAGPYAVDTGIWPIGLPPNYIPLGMSDGDIKYGYKLMAWNNAYSIVGGELTDVVPNDDAPSAPELLGLLIVPKASGTGVAVYMEWSQPPAPENSDIKYYVLSRLESPQTSPISIIIEDPFDMGTPVISYQDNTVIAGKSYLYMIHAADYTGHVSAQSNSKTITMPGGEVPPP